MSHWAAPGVRCVCIVDPDAWESFRYGDYRLPSRVPMRDEVLTVREAFARPWGVYLLFWEIAGEQRDGPLSATLRWNADNFRPLQERKTDIGVLEQLLAPTDEVAV